MNTLRSLAGVLLIAVSLLIFFIITPQVSAQDVPRLINRSLNIHTSEPGATTDYTFSWQLPSNMTVGSIRFVLCGDPYLNDACGFTPAGDFSGASLPLINQTGAVTGFSIAAQSADEILLTRTPAMAGTGQSTYVFNDIVNPTGIHSAFFVRVYVYPTVDGSGAPGVYAAVASATASPIMINTVVPQILYFCAALTITEWCEDVNGNFIDYGMLDPVNGHAAISQFGAATNAPGGYVITVNGSTLTSGNKLIDALSVPAPNTPGTAQFGINLRANTNPPNGQEVFGAGIGVVAADYGTPDMFKYQDGDIIATAATGTLFNTYTVTYIVNIPPDQPSGIYNTTVAYICTAAF